MRSSPPAPRSLFHPAFQHVLQCNSRQIPANFPVQPLPHRQRQTFPASLAPVGVLIHTGHRRYGTLGNLQNLQNRVFLRAPGQTVSPLMPPHGLQTARLSQLQGDLLQIFFRNFLPLGNVLQRHIALLLVLRHVQHHPHRISALGRNFHLHRLHIPIIPYVYRIFNAAPDFQNDSCFARRKRAHWAIAAGWACFGAASW